MPEANSSNPVSASLLKVVRCPSTRSRLDVASQELIASLNERIQAKQVFDVAGRTIETEFDSGLVNEERSIFYPIVGGILRIVDQDAIVIEEKS